MIPHYEIYYTDANGQFVLAPNPPPPEWRERKGVCRRCGEKVFVKAGPLRSFWTHGKGKTCVEKANRVDAAITAAEEYARNRGALSTGDEAMKAGFEEQIGSDAKRLAEANDIIDVQTRPAETPVAPTSATAPEPVSRPVRAYPPSHLPAYLPRSMETSRETRKGSERGLYSEAESDRLWKENYADKWKAYMAEKRRRWHRT